MSENDQGAPEEIQTPSRIGVSYDGIMAEKMEWRYQALARIESAGSLRTAVAIRNMPPDDSHEISQVGDALIMQKVPRAEDLFVLRSSPNKFLRVNMDFSTARAEILIDDQGLANERMRSGRFEEDVFVADVDRLTKVGLKSVLSKEKKNQAKDSSVTAAGAVVLLAPLIGVASVGFILEFQALISVLNKEYEGVLIKTILPLLAVRGVATVWDKFAPGLTERLVERFERKDPVYSETFADEINPFTHLIALKEGKKALRQTVVEKKNHMVI
jgi:hypothetical protein